MRALQHGIATTLEIIALIMALAMLMMLVVLVVTGSTKRDDSDPAGGISGFSVFTDALTGCQYVGFGAGMFGKAITPRIAADGKSHAGCRGAKP